MLDFRRLFLSVGAPILGAVGSMWLVFTIMEADRNVLAQLMEYLGYAGLILGIFWPRAGFFFLIGISGYLDFFKRLLILAGDVNWNEIIDVLKVAPLTLVGIFVGLVIKRWLEGRFFSKGEWILFWTVTVFGSISVGLAYKESHNLFAAIAMSANTAVYVILIVVIPLLFETLEEIIKVLRLIVWVFIPVAIYGIIQHHFGLSQFEFEYIKSGYTSTIGNLYDIKPRPFSTLNSTHAYSIMMAALFILSTVFVFLDRRKSDFLMMWVVQSLIPLLFLYACFVSLARTAWVMAFLGFILTYVYQSKIRVISFYLSAIVTFMLIIFNAGWMLDNIDVAQKWLPTQTEFQEQAFRLGTYSDRLESLKNLTSNSQLWTAFGSRDIVAAGTKSRDRSYLAHDAISQAVVSYGFVGLGIAMVFASLFLYFVHLQIFRTVDPRSRIMSCGILSVISGIFITGIFSGSPLSVFPINLFFWLFVGSLIMISIYKGCRPPANRDHQF